MSENPFSELKIKTVEFYVLPNLLFSPFFFQLRVRGPCSYTNNTQWIVNSNLILPAKQMQKVICTLSKTKYTTLYHGLLFEIL